MKYTTAVKAAAAFEVDAIEFVVDLPRAVFLNACVTPQGGARPLEFLHCVEIPRSTGHF